MSQASSSRTVPPRGSLRDLFPVRTIARLGVAWAMVAAFVLGGHEWLRDPIAAPAAVVCFVVLFATILLSSFGVVREADHLAHALGEPYGTLILTLSIVSIEVILIAAVMTGPGDTPTIGRDSIFAVMMIILNLVTGVCLVFGGWRHGAQEYNAQGAAAYMSMILILTVTALALPNVTGTGDGSFLPAQAIAISVLTVLVYAGFLALQMGSYRRFFVQPEAGSMAVPARRPAGIPPRDRDAGNPSPRDRRAIVVRSIVLIALILPIVLLAHYLAVLIDLGVEHAGMPAAVGGVLIAIIVFTPESITAVRAALADQMQRTVNLCLGAFVSTVGLTVPAVLTIGLVAGKTVTLGLTAADGVLMVMTIALSALTFAGQRTSPVQGMMHLMLFAVYGVFLLMP